MTALWPEHPLFGAETQGDAAGRLDLFSDGLIALAADGRILSANAEAGRMLGIDPGAIADILSAELETEAEGWLALTQAVAAGRRADMALRGVGGRAIVATLSRAAGEDHVQWITLRDVEAFEFRRDRAFGRPKTGNIRFLSAERTRPDFATQRQLCPEINRLLSRGERAIRQGARILVTGESGVGKSEIARFLHSSVADARDPFVIVNCSSSSETRFDALLFGHDASDGSRRPGMIDQAEGGTLFLDEVGEIPLSAQAKLLGFLEDGQQPHWDGRGGGVRHTRVISATNRDLRQLVREGRFRADLYFRLAVINLNVPPLRDLTPLVGHLVDRFAQTINQRRQAPMIIPQRVREILADYSFPGNIRELLNIVQRIAIFLDDSEDMEDLLADLIAPMDIPGTEGRPDPAATATEDLRYEVRRFERALIDKAIRIHGSKRKAAKALGVDIGTIVRKTAEPVEDGAAQNPNKMEFRT